MISSLSSDTSEEARSKIQKWQFELTEAEENLEDTQRDRYISDTQKILDRLYNTFETYIDNRMDNRDALLAELNQKVKDNADTIKTTLKYEGEELGTGISSTMKELWKNPEWNSIEDAIIKRDGRLQQLKDSINGTDNSLTAYMTNYGINTVSGKLGNIYDKIVKINTNLGNVTETEKGTHLKYYQGDITSENVLKSTDIALERLYKGMDGLVKKYGEWAGTDKQKSKMVTWLKNRGYSSGKRKLSYDELAWTQENGLEAIIRPTDGAILTPLARNDSILNSTATQNLWDIANDPLQFIKENSTIPNLPTKIYGGDYDIQQSMVVTLPNVKNYPEFVAELQKDKKFEQMLQDMTINRLTGGSQLAKYKHKY